MSTFRTVEKGVPGPYREVTEEFAERVAAELERRGWKQVQLAREIGCDKATITNLLKRKRPTNRWVDHVTELFGWPYEVHIPDPESRRVWRLMERLRELAPEDYQEEVDFVEERVELREKDRKRKRGTPE